MPYAFTPPTYRFRGSTDSLFGRRWVDVGQTVLKFGTSYRLYRYVSAEDVEAADVAYLGGRTYLVSDTEGAALIAAGYGSNLVPVGVVVPPSPAVPYPGTSIWPSLTLFPGEPS